MTGGLPRALVACRPRSATRAADAWRALLDADAAFREAQGTPEESAARWEMFDALDEFTEACFVDSLPEEEEQT